jgi:hypothetical protein
MPTITEDAIWNIGETARQATLEKAEPIASAAKIAAKLAVDVVTKLSDGEMTPDDLRLLISHATEMATEKLSDLVADVAEDLAEHHL